MQRVKLLQANKYGSKDQIVVIDNNEAFGLIDSGQAILTKEMTQTDYKLTSDEVQADGSHIKLRPNRQSKR